MQGLAEEGGRAGVAAQDKRRHGLSAQGARAAFILEHARQPGHDLAAPGGFAGRLAQPARRVQQGTLEQGIFDFQQGLRQARGVPVRGKVAHGQQFPAPVWLFEQVILAFIGAQGASRQITAEHGMQKSHSIIGMYEKESAGRHFSEQAAPARRRLDCVRLFFLDDGAGLRRFAFGGDRPLEGFLLHRLERLDPVARLARIEDRLRAQDNLHGKRFQRGDGRVGGGYAADVR